MFVELRECVGVDVLNEAWKGSGQTSNLCLFQYGQETLKHL